MAARLSPEEILERLVAFPTVSRESNLDLVSWVGDYLSDHGIESQRVPDPGGRKASLFAHVGPLREGAVVLSGHTDVVPVEGQGWTSDPFTLTLRDGRYYGRGTCDMKGFDALAIWALVEAAGRGLRRPLQLALSYDEEVGCLGAPPLIEAMARALPKGAAVIVGEPSMMQVVTAHKGGYGFRTRVIGHEVHSSLLHRGVSAIMQAARLIQWANEANALSASAPPSEVAALFDPPWTTVHVGMIRGGTAANITAGACRFTMDMRVLPDEDPADWRARYLDQVRRVERDMQAVHPQARIEVQANFGVPALRPEPDGAAEALARRLTGDNGTHVVSYGTEAGQFQQAGLSAVICGPGSIEQAHQADEFITVAQFRAGRAFMERLLDHLREG